MKRFSFLAWLCLAIATSLSGQMTAIARYTFEDGSPGTVPATKGAIKDTSGQAPANDADTVGTATTYVGVNTTDGATGKIGIKSGPGGGFSLFNPGADKFTSYFVFETLVRFDGPEPGADETLVVRRDGNTIAWHVWRRSDGKIEFLVYGTGADADPIMTKNPISRGARFVRVRASLASIEGRDYVILTAGDETVIASTSVKPLGALAAAFTPRVTIGDFNPGNRVCACTFDEVSLSLGSLTVLQPTGTSISSAASGVVGVTPGAWTSLYGTNLLPFNAARSWGGTDFKGDLQPTDLHGTSVCFGTLCAPLAYVSQGQLNFLTPDDLPTPAGQNTTATVTTPLGKFTIQVVVKKRSPAFFVIGGKFAAAVHLTGAVVAANGTFPGAITTPAAPGEVILLFGTGFGPVSSAVPTARLYSSASPLSVPFSVRIDGVLVPQANVLFAGRSAGHLDQVNLSLPAGITPGDHEIQIEVEGVVSPEKVYVSVAGR